MLAQCIFMHTEEKQSFTVLGEQPQTHMRKH